jgi:hypothetical protein
MRLYSHIRRNPRAGMQRIRDSPKKVRKEPITEWFTAEKFPLRRDFRVGGHTSRMRGFPLDSPSIYRCFDVLPMLEATIGRNEVSSKESEDTETSSESGDGMPFTKNDANFLRFFRISEGE